MGAAHTKPRVNAVAAKPRTKENQHETAKTSVFMVAVFAVVRKQAFLSPVAVYVSNFSNGLVLHTNLAVRGPHVPQGAAFIAIDRFTKRSRSNQTLRSVIRAVQKHDLHALRV